MNMRIFYLFLGLLVLAAVAFGYAMYVWSADRDEENLLNVKANIPEGCTLHDLGAYPDLRRLIIVTCNGQTTVSTNYSWPMSKGRNEQITTVTLGLANR